jgi:hypothetical protein
MTHHYSKTERTERVPLGGAWCVAIINCNLKQSRISNENSTKPILSQVNVYHKHIMHSPITFCCVEVDRTVGTHHNNTTWHVHKLVVGIDRKQKITWRFLALHLVSLTSITVTNQIEFQYPTAMAWFCLWLLTITGLSWAYRVINFGPVFLYGIRLHENVPIGIIILYKNTFRCLCEYMQVSMSGILRKSMKLHGIHFLLFEQNNEK